MSNNGNKSKKWSKAKIIKIKSGDELGDKLFDEWIVVTFDFFAKYELSKEEAIRLHRISQKALEETL